MAAITFTSGMRPFLLALAAGVLAAPTPSTAASLGAAGSSARAWPRGNAVVGYRNEASLRAALARYPATVVRRIPPLRVAEVRPAGSTAGFATNVGRLPGVRFVERLAAREQHVEPALSLPAGRVLPWEWQYAVTREDAVPPWVLRAASAMTIGVVDSGADLTAPDLAEKAPATYNVRTGSADVTDTLGHGTFVSALAAGSTTNNEGIAGFGGDARLLVVKAAAADGSFTDLDEANGIVYAVDHGARVLNLSLGGPNTSTTERRAIDYAAAHGVLLVVAAGNEAQAGNPVEYPAALVQPVGSKGVGGVGLAVGASTISGTRAQFSNVGSYISLVAPGDGVFSAVATGAALARFPRVALPGSLAGEYGYASGTSFSAPEVSGAAALVWAANPLLDAAGVAEVLKASASGNGVWNADVGYGVIDVGDAVALAAGIKTPASKAMVTLGASLKKRVAKVTVSLRAAAPGVSPASRVVVLEMLKGNNWIVRGQGTTSNSGQSTFRLALRKGTYRLRARWGGAGDLAGAVSSTLVLRAPS